MRKVVFGGADSLDNYLARPDHAVDWLMWCDEATAGMADFWTTFDTVLMGRRTYEVAVRSGQSDGYPGLWNHVFSRTLKNDPGAAVTVVGDDAVGFVRRLKQREGKDICLMGEAIWPALSSRRG